jgi:hypothetical protein
VAGVVRSLQNPKSVPMLLARSSRFALLVVKSSSTIGSEYRIRALQWTVTVTMTGRLRARPKAGPAVRLPLAVSFTFFTKIDTRVLNNHGTYPLATLKIS